jgi:molybdopterin biosynthesis enzyme
LRRFSHDVVLLNGGVGVDDYDYVVGAAKLWRYSKRFHKSNKPENHCFLNY